MRAGIYLRIDEITNKSPVIRNITETNGELKVFITWLEEDVTMIFSHEAFDALVNRVHKVWKEGR